MSNREGEPGVIAEALQLVFPGASSCRVAAAGIGQDLANAFCRSSGGVPLAPRLQIVGSIEYGKPLTWERKSWTFTRVGVRSHLAPALLKLPTSSLFLASTLTMGLPCRPKRRRNLPI